VQPRAKVVVHWHSDVVRQRGAMRLYRPLQHWLLRRADAVVATSDVYAQSSPCLQAWRHKTVVIPIGISEPERPAEAAVQRVRRKFDHRRIVLALGRMAYYKGFDVLIECAAQLPEGVVIVVGGVGELLAAHRAEVARRGLEHQIKFVGAIAAEELPAYFAAAAVFCLPSTQRAEAYGVVLLEAMAAGKPLITTQIPGSAVSWINQNDVTGLSVPVGDATALCDAVHRITAFNATAARMGAAARARFDEHFGAETMVERTLNLYAQLLK
jgi:glycosyltransferase involved in cell wall biosynthesis